MKIAENKAEKVGGGILLIFSLVLLFVLIPSQVKEVKGFGVSPRVFPIILSMILLVLSLSLFWRGHSNKATDKDTNEYEISAKETKLVLLTVLLIGAYIVMLEYLGYLITTVVVLGFLMYMYGQKNIKSIVITSLVIPLTIYYFFTKLMQIRLP